MAIIVDKTKKGLELAAAHFIWRKLGWDTLQACRNGIIITYDDLCKVLAEFARERRNGR